ncbi:hypothetical protein CRN37_09540 [Vibrio vulnificus]|uniref:hypothetical protein n=1 Tax=Vibrio vulnificus TaxID=672 RepID=UPI000CD0341A|nr:hypothetical protein [Vibrio vulnificus]POC58499.1 hypothetical protein CRN37_09540 [Vibrio vulnificus]POC73069.1 hypothetical protein CRN34_09380 [Vibrio vulnificus]
MENSNNFFQLVAEFQKNIDWLNQILKGTLTESVVIDGVVKPTISKSVNDAFTAINAQISGRQAFQTYADMVASGTPPSDKLLAEVWNDGTSNGLYGWTGSTWKRSDYDLYKKVSLLNSSQGNSWYVDLAPASSQFEENKPHLISAILDCYLEDEVNKNSQIYAWIITNEDPSYNNQFVFRDQVGAQYTYSKASWPDGWESGPVWITATSGSKSKLHFLVDFRLLPTGVLWNGNANSFGLSQSWLQSQGNTNVAVSKNSRSIQNKRGCLAVDYSYSLGLGESFDWAPFMHAYECKLSEVHYPIRFQGVALNHEIHGDLIAVVDGEGNRYTNANGLWDEKVGDWYVCHCRGKYGTISILFDRDGAKADPEIGDIPWNNNTSSIVLSGNEGLNDGARTTYIDSVYPMVDLPASSLTTTAKDEIAKSIKHVEVVRGDFTVEDLWIQVFVYRGNDHGLGYDERIWICRKDPDQTLGYWDGTRNPDGDTEIVLKHGDYEVIMVLDFNVITSTGLLINGLPGVAPISLSGNNVGRHQAMTQVYDHEKSYHLRQWMHPLSYESPRWNDKLAHLADSVTGFWLSGLPLGTLPGIGIITKNSAAYGTSVTIHDQDKRALASGRVSEANEDGETLFELTPIGSYQVHGKLWLDLRPFPDDSVLENTNTPALILDPEYVELRALNDMIKEGSGDNPVTTTGKTYVRDQVRLACLGSSITWGSGYIGESSFVGAAEKYLRETMADTVLGRELSNTTPLSEPLQYRASIAYLEGVGASTEVKLSGDEFSLAICKERGNEHAAIVEVYVNGGLHKRFSTYNDEPYQENVTKTITAAGTDKSWDLGVPFTFNQTVTKNGTSLTGGLYVGGYGGSWPSGWEWMIVRKVSEEAGLQKVTHWLTFKDKPSSGDEIVCTYSHGESIKPGKSTIGNKDKGIGSGIESTYGDGNISYDPANPVGLSSGLDFRHTDKRSVETIRFDTESLRTFEIRVVGVDPRSTGGEPRLYLGYVTNKMHFIMNAGIGGFKASDFNKGYNDIKGHYRVSEWKPTHITIESCTNDDWGTNKYVCWANQTMTQDQLFNVDSMLWLQGITNNGDGSYTVSDSRMGYESISPFTVVLPASTTEIGDIQPGDIVSFGLWKGDNRTVTSKVITHWDATTRMITWAEELRLDEFGWKMDSLNDIEVVQVRSLVAWKAQVDMLLDSLEAANPDAKISIATSGVPNMRIRRLEGYTPYGKKLARERGIGFVDYYHATRSWSEGVRALSRAYLNSSGGESSNGSSELPLWDLDGNPIQNRWTLRGWSVRVNGVERYLDGCYVIGGARRGWTNPDGDLNMGNYAWVYDQYKVVFTDRVPAAGSIVEVSFSADQWSGDDCHPGGFGYNLFGIALNEWLRNVL